MLKEKLQDYLNENYYPFHMPGHKRNTKLLDEKLGYAYDITEIVNFDNLNDPKTLFKDLENKVKDIYEVHDSIISTNGSTCGILASIRDLTKKNKKILVARNCHKSVFNACEVFSLEVDYIKTITNKYGIIYDIDYDDLEEKITKNSYAFVLVTSPNYEGYFLDLQRIQSLLKDKDIPLVCDMAHGSHLRLTDDYKKYKFFDLAIVSFHKNLSALTPASAVLINNQNININELRRNMAIFQTSSPSYLILQSIDEMVEKYNMFYKLYEKLNENLNDFYKIKLEKLEIINNEDKDRTKIVISCKNTNISAKKLQEKLLDEKIEIEMADSFHLVLISTIFDTKDGFNRLKIALLKIDKTLEFKNNKIFCQNVLPSKKMEIYQALNENTKKIPIYSCENRVCAQLIYSYPPGIPMLVPGEIISSQIINQIRNLISNGGNISIEDLSISVVN